MADLPALALALPDVQQGIACAGTSLESRTFAVGKKAFLFVSAKEARLKLDASLAAARAAGHAVGANGWVKLDLQSLPTGPVLRTWIAESHALMGGAAKPAATKATRRPKSVARSASARGKSSRRV